MGFFATFTRALGVCIITFLATFSILTKSMSEDFNFSDEMKTFFNYIHSFEERFYDYRIRRHLDLIEGCQIDVFVSQVQKHQIYSMEAFVKKFSKEALNKFLKDCDSTQHEQLVEHTTLNQESFAPLLSTLKKTISELPQASIIQRTSDVREGRLHENKRYVSDDIVLIEIDDESLSIINSWPIPRENWKTLLDNLNGFGAKVIAFDILFPEEAKSCGVISPDQIFVESIQSYQSNGTNKVILPFSLQSNLNSNVDYFDELPFELYGSMLNNSYQNEGTTLLKTRIESHTWPISSLLSAEPELGYLTMDEDNDGVFRNYRVAADVGDIVAPSLGFRSYLSYSGHEHKIIVDEVSSRLELNDKNNVELNTKGETKLRWIGSGVNYDSIPLYRVLQADPNDQSLKKFFNNKLVFIGSTATGAHDLRNTAIDPKLPGVYAHINFADMLLQEYFYKPSEESIKYSLIFLAVSMLTLVLAMFFGSAILDIVVLIIILAATYYLDYKYFILDGYQVQLFFVYFSVLATYSYVTFLNFNKASAEKKQIKGAFSRYVAPSIVDEMLDNPEKLKVGGEKRDITCMFSDVRDFTSISEKLTPTELALALNRYMGEMTDIVFETKGTLDKYIGDAIVAFWGAPVDIEDHVNSAMDASVKMLEALPKINEEFASKGLPEFKIGLGLNSGECSVGNMGSDQIFAYTALGDNMNLGARLESLCKFYGAQILISEYTFERMDKERFVARQIDKVRVKGKSEPVGVYEVLYSYHPLMQDKKAFDTFNKGFQNFIAGEFEQAKKCFEEVLESHHHDKSSLRMREACLHWIENPPQAGEDWTITTMTTKG
ncbi:MAG: hypothetical protein CME62_18225 [Halobacteriovoraceae bacterium]|nr:hypothetical protein [Halobacteriovoraceae bacterium]|tara:strand:+ start:3008 stop:5503 length:2496 start_codon:yes stop_codon:yes gene_type:complete